MTTAISGFQATIHDPERFAGSLLKIKNKSRHLVPFRWNTAQRHYMAHRTKRDLIVKSRQLGFSTVIQAELHRLAWTRPTSVLTMADTDDNTAKLRRMAQRFYDNIPPRLPKPVRSEANATMTVYPGIGSEVQTITGGSVSAGRGSTATAVHLSEAAHLRNAENTIAAALQAVPEHLDNTWIVFESTANGAQGYFYEESMAALVGESEWTLHFYAWWWGAEYQTALDPGEVLTYTDEENTLIHKHGLRPEQIKWRRKKMRDLKKKFQQEYPESPEQAFLTSGGGVFYLLPENLYDGATREDDSRIVAGLDWGQDNDYTVLSIIELRTGEPHREIYLNRWRKMLWGAMRSNIIEALVTHGVEKITAERNSMGSSQIEDLVNDIEATDGLDCSVQAFTMTNQGKHKLVTMLKTALENGLQLLDIAYATHELRTYQTKQTSSGLWTYSAPDGKNNHDDTVIARMLANYTASQLWI